MEISLFSRLCVYTVEDLYVQLFVWSVFSRPSRKDIRLLCVNGILRILYQFLSFRTSVGDRARELRKVSNVRATSLAGSLSTEQVDVML